MLVFVQLGALAQEAGRKTNEMVSPAQGAVNIDLVQDIGKGVRGMVGDLEYIQTSFEEDQGFVRELETGVLRGTCPSCVVMLWRMVLMMRYSQDEEGGRGEVRCC